jgi:[FeFe] hydrogenase H-cluster maturation GTPase HydF
MSLNETPRANRVHIAFFGLRNAGKSSVINAITGQETAIVSEIRGTTTDPVYKAMELLPLGPVVLIDTPGIDDEGALGVQRVNKARQVLNKTDVAVLVADACLAPSPAERELIDLFREKAIPFLLVLNKDDLAAKASGSGNSAPDDSAERLWQAGENERVPSLSVSAKTGAGIHDLKERLAVILPAGEPKTHLVADLLAPSDLVVLVVPIDKAAPKGRLILPQQQVIRDILDADGTAVVVREFGLRDTLEQLGKRPRLVVTDSQVFAQVSSDTPSDVPLTSFSILFARYKGLLSHAVRAASALEEIEDGDRILIAEGCTHHRQCDDIGTVKLPRWIRDYTGRNPSFTFTSGAEFPEDLSAFRLIVHCGGCMLNEREMQHRLSRARTQEIPLTNYGVFIAHMQGILSRCVAMFPEVLAEIGEEATQTRREPRHHR